jgi:lysyl-tRNA synthetase class 1
MSTAKPPKSVEEIPNHHWADHAAEQLIQLHPEKSQFVAASGISPSGMVHIGNFREVITSEFVVRALKDRGKQVRFLYSWDDYDAFRKVPANLPQKDVLEKNLRRPISEVPDPFGTDTSYASHFEKEFEAELKPMGIAPEYIYQSKAYKSFRYTDGIRTALENQATIVKVLNASRTEPLPADWWCVSVYCKDCGKDVTTVRAYRAPTLLDYSCKICKKDDTIDFAKEAGAKLLWRVDWPMRWAFEGVDFEPGGKDHSSMGGSFDTGSEIIRQVWKREPPFYVQYDFVLAKGLGAKLSSSSGNLITLAEAQLIYEPAVIRWIFASRKPNLDFTIAFDLDVMRTYDDFDRCERYAYGTEEGEPRKVSYEKRIYELSCPTLPTSWAKQPAQFGFRHLCNMLQINEGNLEKTKALYAIENPEDAARFTTRAERAWKWINEFAPDEFKFKLRTSEQTADKTAHPQAIEGVIALLEKPGVEKQPEDVLANSIYEVMKSNGLDAKRFFPEIYRALIGKPNGPRLASFLIGIGPTRAAALLRDAV